MPQNDYNQLIEKFQQFRQHLYNCFPHRCDSVMDLLDALSSNEKANSIVELCLSPLFFAKEQLCVLAADNYYSQRCFLNAIGEQPNLVIVTRARFLSLTWLPASNYTKSRTSPLVWGALWLKGWNHLASSGWNRQDNFRNSPWAESQFNNYLLASDVNAGN